ncbi:MAG: sigma-54-dependent transcriptional regulator, partial [Planctomycetota bacterium]
MSTILIVDDEPNVLASFQKMLATQKHRVMTAARGEAALALVEKKKPDLLVMDIRMPGMDGLTAFRKLRETHPKLPVIIMTGFGTTEAAIEATKLGAFDYHLKPFEPADMLRSIKGALESARLMRRHVRLDPDSEAPSADAIIGQSEGMRGVYKAIGRVAETDATVLVRGETGTGKELVARAVYQHSRRAEMPLVVVNCVAIPETLLESELFGHEKGAFTGASARRIGKFEQAAGGTIFLDEIGDMPLSIQSKMLRVLQERSLERVGGHNTISVDVRVIAATNRDLEKAIAEGKFRDDLYHRLDVFTIDLPPLRERREDIPRLVAYFLDRFARELGVEKPVLSEPALEALRGYGWPGNVRELEHCIHRA